MLSPYPIKGPPSGLNKILGLSETNQPKLHGIGTDFFRESYFPWKLPTKEDPSRTSSFSNRIYVPESSSPRTQINSLIQKYKVTGFTGAVRFPGRLTPWQYIQPGRGHNKSVTRFSTAPDRFRRAQRGPGDSRRKYARYKYSENNFQKRIRSREPLIKKTEKRLNCFPPETFGRKAGVLRTSVYQIPRKL